MRATVSSAYGGRLSRPRDSVKIFLVLKYSFVVKRCAQ